MIPGAAPRRLAIGVVGAVSLAVAGCAVQDKAVPSRTSGLLTCAPWGQPGRATSMPDCAAPQADSSYRLSGDALSHFSFGPEGLAEITIGSHLAYVRRDGRAIAVPVFDNGPDLFVDGRVRMKVGNRLGYADWRLEPVISAIYDGAYPFSGGRAHVCIGCTIASDGEHSWYEGGQGMCLDTGGNMRPEEECRAE